MYAAFLDAIPLILSFYQSGFYHLVHGKSIKTYQEAWLVVEESKRK